MGSLSGALGASNQLVNPDPERDYPSHEEERIRERKEGHFHDPCCGFERIRGDEPERDITIKEAQLCENPEQPRQSNPDQ